MGDSIDTSTRSFKCNYSKCDVVCMSESLLREHLSSSNHKGMEWMHKCQYLKCPASYKYSSVLKVHLLEEHGMKPRIKSRQED